MILERSDCSLSTLFRRIDSFILLPVKRCCLMKMLPRKVRKIRSSPLSVNRGV